MNTVIETLKNRTSLRTYADTFRYNPRLCDEGTDCR